MSKDKVDSEKAVEEKRRKEKEEMDALKNGIKYVTLVKRGKSYKTRLNNGTVADKIYGVDAGWSLERLLDWADRGGVQVYVSDKSRVRGESVRTRLLEAQPAAA